MDATQPVAEKTLHLRAGQSLKIIQRENFRFDVTQFNPFKLGDEEKVYQSDAVKLSKEYYLKLANYVDYLFIQHASSVTDEKIVQLGKKLYDELGDKDGKRFDAIPSCIYDSGPEIARETIKEVMKNLIYLWVVHHGETFSIISVGNAYFFCPTFMRKPLSALKGQKNVMTSSEKK